jgi:broad specificity phosphatase PhoE
MLSRPARLLAMLRLLLLCCLGMMPALLQAAPGETVVFVVRHAEKASDHPRDPTLSVEGKRRALAIAGMLQEESLQAVYATPYRRTQLTAAPTAAAKGLSITLRAAGESADSLAHVLRSRHAGQRVLVVGHSNTVPALVEALAGQPIEAIPEHQYDRFLVVRLQGKQLLELRDERMRLDTP